MASVFKHARSASSQWQEATQDCLSQIGEVPAAANLGFIYVTDYFAEHVQEILSKLQAATGIVHWVGSTGIGICSTGQEDHNHPALVMMLGEFPAKSFHVFPTIRRLDEIHDVVAMGEKVAYFGIVHGDPQNQHIGSLLEQFAASMESGFVVGGLTSSRTKNIQVADGMTHGGISGVVFTDEVALTTRLTQGVSPIGVLHEITECEDNVIIRLNDRPALDVLKEEVGEVLARNLNRLANYIFVGLPITGSDTADYLVRNLIDIDVEQKLLAIGDTIEKGDHILFCRRDGVSAVRDMQRMLDSIKSGIKGVPRGAVYFSCLGRGEDLFGAHSEELKMISRALEDIPLVGFFANGEISHNRLYGYTGVLTVFL
jgi:small ligand-binding sensory domain FIST